MRLAWLDNAKMVAMICVIICHSGPLFANGIPGRLHGLIIAFNMPLFVILAGYTTLRGLTKASKVVHIFEFAEKLLWRMAVPSAVLSVVNYEFAKAVIGDRLWVIICSVVSLLGVMFTKQIKEALPLSIKMLRYALVITLLFVCGWLNMFWFIKMLVKLQLLAYLLSYFYNLICINFTQISYLSSTLLKYKFVFVGALLWVISFLVFDGWTFEMSIYFGIGLLVRHFDIIEKISKMHIICVFGLFIIGTAICRCYTIEYEFYSYSLELLISQGVAYIYVLRVLAALLLCISILRWTVSLSKDYNWFSKMGSRSMAFYIIHVLILNIILKPYVFFDNPHNYMWLLGFLFSFAFTGITYGIILLCERWKVSRGLILGDWK